MFFAESIKNAIKKPFIIWFLLVFLFPVILIAQKISFLEYIIGPKGFAFDNIFDTYFSLLQTVLKYLNTSNRFFIFILSLILISVLVGLVVSVVFSGYFFILSKVTRKYKVKKDDFLKGIKKYFAKTFLASSISLCATVFLLFLLSFIFVPSVVTMNALLAGRGELFFIFVLFVLVTVIVLFLSFTFFRIYIINWFPSIFIFKKKCFKAGVIVANNNFWPMVFTIIGFDIVFIGSRILYYMSYFSIYSNSDVNTFSTILLFIANWIFITIFIYLFIYYIFYSFRNSKESLI